MQSSVIIVMTFVQFTCLWMMRRVCQRQKVRREREKESVFMRHLNYSCQLSMHTRGQTNKQTFNRHIYAHNPKEKTILWIRISSPRIRNKLHTRTHEHTRRSHDFGLLARLWLFCCHHSAHAAQARVVHSRTAFSLRMAVLFSLFNRDDDDSSHTQSYGEVHTRARKNKCVHVCECILFFQCQCERKHKLYAKWEMVQQKYYSNNRQQQWHDVDDNDNRQNHTRSHTHTYIHTHNAKV